MLGVSGKQEKGITLKYHHVSILAVAILLGVSCYSGYTPAALSVVFVIASTVTYWLYAKDKAAAILGAWRIPENSLHAAALLFGWPGALIAQERLRHKTKKPSFRALFWCTVLVNMGAVIWFHSPQGNRMLRQGAYQLENVAISRLPHKGSVSAIQFLFKFRAKEVG